MVKWFSITKNKSFECQLEIFPEYWSYFNVGIEWTRRQDHAGFRLSIEVMRLYFHITIYDIRHWNIAKHRWCDETDYENMIEQFKNSKEN